MHRFDPRTLFFMGTLAAALAGKEAFRSSINEAGEHRSS